MSERVGQQLGNYHLLSLLGQGGFADVYLGEHIYLKTKAAIKVLQVRITGNDMETFLKEAQIIAALKHPRIVRILDFGLDGTIPFLIMDYAPNGTLRDIHPKGTIVPISKIVPYVKQIAAALQYAHEQKLIHRDVKPENMLLETNNDLLLSDFGLATIVNTATAQSTKHVAGTPYYMAPEQFKGKARFASDQYALAAVVYEWLCGEPPYAEGDFIQLGFQHSYEPLPPLKEKIPSIPGEIEQVLTKALSKDLQQRFTSIQEFADSLEAASQPKKPPIIIVLPKPEPKKPSVPKGTVHYIYRGHTSTVRAVAWSPSGKYIASGGSDTLRIWEALNGQPKFISSADIAVVHAIAWLSNESLLSGHQNGAVEMWSDVGNKIRTCNAHSEPVYALSCAPDGKRFVSGSDDNTACVWERASGKNILTYRGHSNDVHSVAWSPDGSRIASASSDKTVQIWDAATGRSLFTYKGHFGFVRSLTWSPDSKRIASGSWDNTVHVWNANNGGDVLIYRGHEDYVQSVAYSSDGKYIASGGFDTTVHVWDALTGNLLIAYRGHTEHVDAIAWSPDSRLVVSGCSNFTLPEKDCTVHVWQAV